MSKEKLSAPPKHFVNKSSIISPHLSLRENVNIDNQWDQIETDLQEINKVNITNSASRYSSKVTASTSTYKLPKAQVDPFATCLDINSLEGLKKQKCV